jgi:hypothetical protein
VSEAQRAPEVGAECGRERISGGSHRGCRRRGVRNGM